MTKGEAIATAIATLKAAKQFGIDKCIFDKEEIEAFDMAIEALQALPDGDLISRQDAIRWVKTECNPYGKPTLDFESGKRVIEHLEQMQSAEPPYKYSEAYVEQIRTERDILQDMVNNMAEPKTGEWIPCSERLPSEPFGCIVTVWDSTPTGEGDDFENILPYFVGWDGEQWNDEDGEQCPFEVIAWMPLPEPYREDEEE